MKRNLSGLYQARYGIKAPMRGYQLKAAAVGVKNPAYALLMSPRLGKTRVDIAVTGHLYLTQGISRWLIICPSVAKDVWATELAQTLDIPHVITVVDGAASERRALVKGWLEEPGKLSILIINHEATWRLKKLLYKFRPDKTTIDESQRIKNRSAKQSVSAHALGRRSTYRCILTGTIGDSPVNVFSQYKFLDPGIFGDRWKDFTEHYVSSYGFGGFKPKRFKNLDEFREKLHSIAFVLTRKQAGGFPEELSQTIRFDLSPQARKAYTEMEEQLRTMVGSHVVSADIILTQILRMQQITGGFLPTPSGEDGERVNTPIGFDRIKALSGLLGEYDPREPLVIFCRFRYELEAIRTALKKATRTSSAIVGGQKTADRDLAKHQFQGGKVDTCVVQIRAGGLAIDLSRADTAIFYTTTQSYIDYEQALARIISRRGGSVALLHLAAKNTLDESVLESLVEKSEMADLILKVKNQLG